MSKDSNLTENHQSSEEAEVSGRWIRDQLRDVADSSIAGLEALKPISVPDPPPPSVDVDDVTTPDLVGNLAASISNAVAAPIRDLERQRSAEKAAVEKSLDQNTRHIQEAVTALERMVEDVQQLQADAEKSREESKTLRDRLEQMEGEGLNEALSGVRTEIQELGRRLEEAESAGKQDRERVEALTVADSRRRESMRHLGDLLDRVRETVRMMESEPREAEQPSDG